MPSQQEQHFDNQPVMNDNNDSITMMTTPSQQQQQFHNQQALNHDNDAIHHENDAIMTESLLGIFHFLFIAHPNGKVFQGFNGSWLPPRCRSFQSATAV